MKRVVEVAVDLYGCDIVDYLTNSDETDIGEVIYLLSNKYYNDPELFKRELKYVRDYIKEDYNQNVQNNIQNMFKDMYNIFMEVDDDKLKGENKHDDIW